MSSKDIDRVRKRDRVDKAAYIAQINQEKEQASAEALRGSLAAKVLNAALKVFRAVIRGWGSVHRSK